MLRPAPGNRARPGAGHAYLGAPKTAVETARPEARDYELRDAPLAGFICGTCAPRVVVDWSGGLGMPCVICGSTSTVKSHIIPRSLFRHGLTPGRQVIGSLRDGSGHQYVQSGFWDSNILCAAHEATFQMPDDYAAKVVRATMTGVGPDDVATLSNPTPRHLVLFAAACVWRMAVSRSDGRPERILGPYAERLRTMIFDGSDFDPMLLVSRCAYRNGDEHLRVGVLPHPYTELGIGFWRFVAAGLVFDMKLDNRAAPPEMRTLAVNAAEEFRLFPDIPVNVRADRPLFASLARMAAPRRRGSV